MSFVLDASVALLWLVPQTNPAGVDYASAALKALKESQAIAPSLMTLEIANVVAKLELKGLVAEADSQRFIALLGRLNIVTDQATAPHALGDTLNLARRYKLSAYDAAYLELALRAGLPLATLDANLAKAATTAGVPIFGMH
ncbi:MAG: type II toxin-antitoxin system VapC family toxin [Rhodoferax sp.]|uniref:type II toxin-antitoxin system VapC family toxin n=1 Tax=Rhodoferax sp. TaxID=50421 RepID=UPI0013FF2642|nr:type II toxin-antitoxin system VapC family toxin [Rhodoferax sp.]NDP39001.1 type II toxin-antitoxin system VapC family toxin [Rhodoferax sp.]